MSNMWEGLGDNAPAEGTNTAVPVGTHLAKVDGFKINHEKGNVGLAFYFNSFGAKEWGNYYIRRKDGTPNWKQIDLLIKMFKSLGLKVERGPQLGEQMEAAIAALKGHFYQVNKTVNGNFSNYYIEENASAPVSASQSADEPMHEDPAVDDDLPF